MVALKRCTSLSVQPTFATSVLKKAAALGPKSADAATRRAGSRGTGESGADNELETCSDLSADLGDASTLFGAAHSPGVLRSADELSSDGSDSSSPARTFGLRRCPAVDDLSLVPGDVELEIDVHIEFVSYAVAASYTAESPAKPTPFGARVTVQSLAPLIAMKRMLTAMVKLPADADSSSEAALTASVTLLRNGRLLDDNLAEIYSYGIRDGDVIHCVL